MHTQGRGAVQTWSAKGAVTEPVLYEHTYTIKFQQKLNSKGGQLMFKCFS